MDRQEGKEIKKERNILLKFSQNSAPEWDSKFSCGKTEQVQETFTALEEKKGNIPKDIAFPAFSNLPLLPGLGNQSYPTMLAW